MKPCFFPLLITMSVESSALGQGTITYIYDQQSANESYLGEAIVSVQPNQPMGQSFIPVLSSVGFIRLAALDRTFNDMGTTMAVNLRLGSITGPILSSTDLVSLPDRFVGPVDFLFSTPVTVTPGVSYYLQPVIQAGEDFGVFADSKFKYPNGTFFYQGGATTNFDLWFREGIIVPEPSVAWLALVGAGVLGWWHRGKSRRSRPQP